LVVNIHAMHVHKEYKTDCKFGFISSKKCFQVNL